MKRLFPALIVCAVLLSGCQATIPPDALKLSHESLQDRQAQTRQFDTGDEKKILQSGAQVLQDLGFNIDESETDLGIIAASKNRDATETGQVVGAVAMTILFGTPMTYDEKQLIKASLVTYKSNTETVSTRVTFQRVVTDNMGKVSKIEALNDQKLYQDFFEKLSQSVFLTANQI